MANEPRSGGSPAQKTGLRVPRHIGVIMDGNGRWAAARGHPRTDGHAEGIKALRRLVACCIRYGTGYLTIFSFSSENWSRPAGEIRFIFSLLHRFVDSDLAELERNNVRVTVIGERDRLDKSLVALIARVEARTAKCTGLNLQVAFNYGGRAEIAHAARRLAEKARDGALDPAAVDEQTIAAELYTTGMPDPDLILRTSGESRLSNFLLWQSAYAELVFIDEYWPEFDETIFLRVLEEYAARDRRFGGLEATAHG